MEEYLNIPDLNASLDQEMINYLGAGLFHSDQCPEQIRRMTQGIP